MTLIAWQDQFFWDRRTGGFSGGCIAENSIGVKYNLTRVTGKVAPDTRCLGIQRFSTAAGKKSGWFGRSKNFDVIRLAGHQGSMITVMVTGSIHSIDLMI